MKKKNIFLVFLFSSCFLITLISISICIENCIVTHLPGSERSDFRQFASSNDLYSYFNKEFVIGETTIDEINEFISRNDIKGCDSYSPTEDEKTANLGSSLAISCFLIGPKQDRPDLNWFWNQLFKLINAFYYHVNFYFCNDILCYIRIELIPVSTL